MCASGGGALTQIERGAVKWTLTQVASGDPPKLRGCPIGELTDPPQNCHLVLSSQGGDCDGFSTFDVPIFTEEFLDQNKAREAELRRLRKMSVAFQEQNAVLQKHTQSMSSARERLEQELALEERRTLALQQQLQAVRQALTASFASLPVPGTGETPTLSTLDFYMARLHGSMESDPALAREAHRPHQGDPGPGRQ